MSFDLSMVLPVAGLMIVFFAYIVSYFVSRRHIAKAAAGARRFPLPVRERHVRTESFYRVYEKIGVDQRNVEDHPLGAIQSVIYGRIRFAAFGLLVMGVAAYGLYAIWVENHALLADYSKTPLHRLASSVILAGSVVYGLRLVSFATARIVLRRTGFEIRSVMGVKAYEYKGVDFILTETIAPRRAEGGYEPFFWKTESFLWLWVCQVSFRDGKTPPLMLKSSRYAFFRPKMQALIDSLQTIYPARKMRWDETAAREAG